MPTLTSGKSSPRSVALPLAQILSANTGRKRTLRTRALREYIQRRQQAKVADLFGQIESDKAYDYKTQRLRP